MQTGDSTVIYIQNRNRSGDVYVYVYMYDIRPGVGFKNGVQMAYTDI